MKAPGPKSTDAAVEIAALPAADEEGESTTIYVKNLAFATSDAGLQVSNKGHLTMRICLRTRFQ